MVVIYIFILIIGQSGSGKSAFAEKKVVEFGDYKRVYLATMQVFDAEGEKRVSKHKKMRESKNFTTIESKTHIENIVLDKENVALLECMSNLVANEIFSDAGRGSQKVADVVCDGIKMLKSQAKHLVVVTNDVFSDGITYDKSTDDYMRKLGEINCRMGNMADEVYEVVDSISLRIK